MLISVDKDKAFSMVFKNLEFIINLCFLRGFVISKIFRNNNFQIIDVKGNVFSISIESLGKSLGIQEKFRNIFKRGRKKALHHNRLIQEFEFHRELTQVLLCCREKLDTV